MLDGVYRDLYAKLIPPTFDIHLVSNWHQLVLKRQLVANRKTKLWMLPRQRKEVRLLELVRARSSEGKEQ